MAHFLCFSTGEWFIFRRKGECVNLLRYWSPNSSTSLLCSPRGLLRPPGRKKGANIHKKCVHIHTKKWCCKKLVVEPNEMRGCLKDSGGGLWLLNKKIGGCISNWLGTPLPWRGRAPKRWATKKPTGKNQQKYLFSLPHKSSQRGKKLCRQWN